MVWQNFAKRARYGVCALAVKYTGLTPHRLRPFLDWCVTLLTRSSVFTPSFFIRNMAAGGRSFVPPKTSCQVRGIGGEINAGALYRLWKSVFVAFSCRQRCCCSGEKRTQLPDMRLVAFFLWSFPGNDLLSIRSDCVFSVATTAVCRGYHADWHMK